MRFIFILFLIFLSSLAQASVSLEAVVYARDNDGASFACLNEGSGSLSDPIDVYIPFTNGDVAGNDQENYIYPAGVQLMEVKRGDGLNNAFAKTPSLYFTVKHTENIHDYIQIMVEDDGSYDIVTLGISGTNEYVNATHDTAVAFYLTLFNLNDAGDTPFSEYYLAGNTDEKKISKKIYIFSSETIVTGTGLNPADYAGGIYLDLKFSSDYPTETIALNKLTRGDSSLIVEYASDGSVSELYKGLSFNYAAAQVASNPLSTASALGSVIDTYESVSNSGSIVVSGLTNGLTYNIAIGLMDKYQFVTKLSPSRAGTPLTIETFLDKKSCYFFSAGFQTDHYVLEYLRSFRDRILLKKEWGKKFVNYYYQTAPQYAHHIYNSKIVSAMVRGVGYCAYSVLNFYEYLFEPSSKVRPHFGEAMHK